MGSTSLITRLRLIFGAFLLLMSIECISQGTEIKRRANSFFGVHFDFHATSNDKNIGLSLTPAMVTSFLTQVRPDFIQVDTKGHPGISSYPTRVGVAANSFAGDPLKVFRAATSSLGIGLYSHFSGVVDEKAVKDHPQWARINSNGQPDATATSIFGPYCDNYFIPQIEELSRNYGIDGVWVDGECWAVQADFSDNAKKAYIAATGKQPKLDADYMAFTRRAFHKYVDHYTNVLHKFDPKLQITSNWAFSTYMPGRVDAGVDFLSGDVVYDDVKNMTIEPRVLSAQGKPWDIMVWGFMGDKNGKGHYWKSPLQLQQKAAIVISQGGGFQVYLTQNRDASIPLETASGLKQVADFCYARKPFCFKAVAVPQVAMLLSAAGHDFDLGTTVAFDQANGGNNNIKGTLAALLNSQYSVQVLQDHNLIGNLSKYPLLVITEWNYLDPKMVNEVQNYVSDGGKLLIIGGVSCNIFSKILPVNTPVDRSNPADLPVKKNNYGKGTVIGIDANVSLENFNNPKENFRKTIAGIAKQLFPTPMVTVTGSNSVHVVLNTLRGETMIHLINVGDRWGTMKDNQLDFQLPKIGQLEVTLRTSKKPSQILLQPEEAPLKFNYNKGVATFKIPKLDVYSIAEVKY
ncbi:MAG: hypothetical protein M3040_00940 [Bacteroidota bacterium]|nr:hypothetical protein [Bacteroidota bacterium]